jgi:chromosome segregation ATPase
VTRNRVRWYHIIVLGVAVLVFAAALGFSFSQSSERDDEAARGQDAQEQLATQRDATTHARTELATARQKTKATLDLIGPLTTTIHEYTDLAAQEIDSVAAAHQIAIDTPDEVDNYNAEVDRGNALLSLIEAKRTQLEQQVEALRAQAQAQLAVAVASSSR